MRRAASRVSTCSSSSRRGADLLLFPARTVFADRPPRRTVVAELAAATRVLAVSLLVGRALVVGEDPDLARLRAEHPCDRHELFGELARSRHEAAARQREDREIQRRAAPAPVWVAADLDRRGNRAQPGVDERERRRLEEARESGNWIREQDDEGQADGRRETEARHEVSFWPGDRYTGRRWRTASRRSTSHACCARSVNAS